MQELYFKLHAVDDSTKATSLERWDELIYNGAKLLQRDWHCAIRFKQYFIDAGFEDVVETRYAWPCNSWPKKKEDKIIGLYQMTNVLDGISAMSTRVLTSGLGWAIEDVETFLADVRKDLKNRSIHGYWPM